MQWISEGYNFIVCFVRVVILALKCSQEMQYFLQSIIRSLVLSPPIIKWATFKHKHGGKKRQELMDKCRDVCATPYHVFISPGNFKRFPLHVGPKIWVYCTKHVTSWNVWRKCRAFRDFLAQQQLGLGTRWCGDWRWDSGILPSRGALRQAMLLGWNQAANWPEPRRTHMQIRSRDLPGGLNNRKEWWEGGARSWKDGLAKYGMKHFIT